MSEAKPRDEEIVSRPMIAGGAKWRLRAWRMGTTLWSGFEWLDSLAQPEPQWISARNYPGEVPVDQLVRLRDEHAADLDRMREARDAEVEKVRGR